jgi:hypothetical protein
MCACPARPGVRPVARHLKCGGYCCDSGHALASGAERFKATFAPAPPPYCEITHTAPHEQRRELVRLGDRDARPRDEGQCRLGVPALLLMLEDAAPSPLWQPFLG